MRGLVDSIINEADMDINHMIFQEILTDLKPMMKNNEDILNSFQINENMKEQLESYIQDFEGWGFDNLLSQFLDLDNQCIEFRNNGETDKNIFGTHLSIVMINEMKKRINFQDEEVEEDYSDFPDKLIEEVDVILTNSRTDVSKKFDLIKILHDLSEMRRSNINILNSFHITKEMKPMIETNIEQCSTLNFNSLIENVFKVNEMSIDAQNVGDKNNSTLGNAILIVMINEVYSRIEVNHNESVSLEDTEEEDEIEEEVEEKTEQELMFEKNEDSLNRISNRINFLNNNGRESEIDDDDLTSYADYSLIVYYQEEPCGNYKNSSEIPLDELISYSKQDGVYEEIMSNLLTDNQIERLINLV